MAELQNFIAGSTATADSLNLQKVISLDHFLQFCHSATLQLI